jgi:cell division septation protein DedD
VRRGFTVQFAAARSEASAREVAAAVRSNGAPPRIVATQTSGTILYRVVLGPFSTEADAERAGKASGRDYWVYEGEP